MLIVGTTAGVRGCKIWVTVWVIWGKLCYLCNNIAYLQFVCACAELIHIQLQTL